MTQLKAMLINAILGCINIVTIVLGIRLGADFASCFISFSFVQYTVGLFFAAGVSYAFNLIARPVKFITKSALIYSSVTEQGTALSAMRAVTLDWKETIGIFAIDKAVRNLLPKIYDFALSKVDNIPSFLKELSEYKLFKTFKKLIILTCDWADECVLAYCYKHEDPMLSECMTGLFLFFKHSMGLTMRMFTMIFLKLILELGLYFSTVAIMYRLCGRGFIIFVVALVLATTIRLCILNPIFEVKFCTGIVYEFNELTVDDTTDDADEFNQTFSNMAEFSALKNAVRRLTDGDTSGDMDSDAESPETAGMEDSE